MPLPQKQEIRRIQINQSQQLLLPQSLLFQMVPHPLPQPLPQNNKRRIQIQLPPRKLLPHPQELFAQPQFVAVKSLMLKPPSFIYGVLYASMPVNVSPKKEKILHFYIWIKDLHKFQHIVKYGWNELKCVTKFSNYRKVRMNGAENIYCGWQTVSHRTGL